MDAFRRVQQWADVAVARLEQSVWDWTESARRTFEERLGFDATVYTATGAPHQAQAGKVYLADTTAADVTFTVPRSTAETTGQRIRFSIEAGANNVVLREPFSTLGPTLLTTLTLTASGGIVSLGTKGWRAIG